MTDEKLINSVELEREKERGALTYNTRPIYMWLESTSRCNLKCITCPRTHLPFFKGRDLDIEVFQKVTSELFSSLKEICLQSFGEPMMASNFEYFFDEVIKNNINVSFITNGMFLTDKWIRKFLKQDINFGVSLDGVQDHTLQTIRPGVNFQRIVNSIKLFNELKEREYPNSKSSVYILFVALRSNVEELPELITLAKNLNISEILVHQLNVSFHPVKIRRESLRYHKHIANHFFMLAQKRADELGITLYITLYDRDDKKEINNTLFVNTLGYRFPQKCFAPWERILVRTNGDVTPCCASGEIMGNIKKDGFWNIWNGIKYRNFRRRINTNFPPLDCRNCIQNIGMNAGNPQNTKRYESLNHKFIYFIDHKRKLSQYVYHYLKDYL